MSLWTSQTIASATQGQCASDFEVTGFSIDSRTIRRGDLFIALQAERDGHDYVAQALSSGASGALVQYVPEGVATTKMVIVKDTQQALTDLGRAARTRTTAKIVAVTGSVGKTGTKEQLRTIFSHIPGTPRVHAAVRSFNNHIGVPLTLARMPEATDFAVFEIGMNHPGEIAPLAKLCQPDVALITTVAPVHLAAFKDVAGIAREKASICAGLSPAGTAVLPRDNAHFELLEAEARRYGVTNILTFGTHEAADARLLEVTLHDTQTVAKAHAFGHDLLFKIGGSGQHLALNALGALACAYVCGVDLAHAAPALANWSPPQGRGDRWQVKLSNGGSVTLIDDSYNANPASMQASLATLAHTQTTGRRIAILTDMLELGPQEAALHRAIADVPAIAVIDQIHLAGPLMQHLYEVLPEAKRGLHDEAAQGLLDTLRTHIRAGDVILVKGSHGSDAGAIVTYIKTHFAQPEIEDILS